jgi:hypothetical protein
MARTTTLATLPPRPTPLQLLSSTKQQYITTCYVKTAERARLAEHTTLATRQPIHVTIKGRTKRNRPSTRTAADATPIDNPCRYIVPIITHHTPVASIIQTCPPKHPRHNTESSRTTEYMVEWNLTTCPSYIAQAHQKRGTPITQVTILSIFSIERPLTPEELYPPCFICLRGEGDSGDPKLIQCEHCLRWIHAQCLPKHTTTAQIILMEGWT